MDELKEAKVMDKALVVDGVIIKGCTKGFLLESGTRMMEFRAEARREMGEED